MFKKGQMDLWKYGQGFKGEVRLINHQSNVYDLFLSFLTNPYLSIRKNVLLFFNF